ncbi:hypothetical protein PCK2_000506 [Pneumocystis canis]|nr:hypothetical protein PCK2_000506 [Pneumocystis canis]
MSIPVEFVKNKGILNNYSFNRPHNGFVLEASPIQCLSLTTYQDLLNFQTNYFNSDKLKVLNDLSSKNYLDLWLFLDEITDPMNMGAILRNAFYFRLNGVILAEKNCAPLSPVVSVASGILISELVKISKVKKKL